MAFFKFRWSGSSEPQGDNSKPARRSRGTAQAESIEDMRRRARHRLIGAAVLVLAGVVGFPMLFDTQPRPVAVNMAIDIPDRNKVAPLVVPQKGGDSTLSTPAAVNEPSAAGLDAGEEVVSSRPRSEPAPQPHAQAETKPEAKTEPRPEPKSAPKPEHKAEAKPEPKTAARQEDAARARALLEGRAQPPAQAAAADQGRFIVQVGAFADVDKAREVRERLERSGLKTYTQVVDTKDGKRTRVRVGPFESRAEADKAAGRVKGAGLSASVLTL
ncbi:MAG: SPOR domain-containing protein [Comamonadaceae bacterium]|nr:SPOR domain-containing protein [Comamonadaceae bacterium]